MSQIPKRPHEAFLVRQVDRAVWEADAVLKIDLDPRYTTTNHPIEDGATVTDHVQTNPEVVVITCVVTENPPAPAVGGPVHLREQVQFLRDTAEAGQLVDIVTRRLGTFKNFLITSVPHVLDGVARLEFPLELKQVKIAFSTTVFIDVEDLAADVVDGAPDNVDLGEQATTSTDTDEEAEDADQSILAGLLDSLG